MKCEEVIKCQVCTFAKQVQVEGDGAAKVRALLTDNCVHCRGKQKIPAEISGNTVEQMENLGADFAVKMLDKNEEILKHKLDQKTFMQETTVQKPVRPEATNAEFEKRNIRSKAEPSDQQMSELIKENKTMFLDPAGETPGGEGYQGLYVLQDYQG